MSSFLARTFSKLNKNFVQLLVKPDNLIKPVAGLHTTVPLNYQPEKGPKKFTSHNEKIYPPQTPDEEPRPAVSANKKYFFSQFLQ